MSQQLDISWNLVQAPALGKATCAVELDVELEMQLISSMHWQVVMEERRDLSRWGDKRELEWNTSPKEIYSQMVLAVLFIYLQLYWNAKGSLSFWCSLATYFKADSERRQTLWTLFAHLGGKGGSSFSPEGLPSPNILRSFSESWLQDKGTGLNGRPASHLAQNMGWLPLAKAWALSSAWPRRPSYEPSNSTHHLDANLSSWWDCCKP